MIELKFPISTEGGPVTVEKYLSYMKQISMMLQQRTISTRSLAICQICSNRIRDVHLMESEGLLGIVRETT